MNEVQIKPKEEIVGIFISSNHAKGHFDYHPFTREDGIKVVNFRIQLDYIPNWFHRLIFRLRGIKWIQYTEYTENAIGIEYNPTITTI